MAIAFDAATDGGNNGGSTSSRTFAHTCTGTNRILFVGVKAGQQAQGDLVTGVTYNSVAMSLVGKRTHGVSNLDGDRWVYLYMLVNPASGSNNVVVSASGNVYLIPGAASYTGANQTGQPDASIVNSVTTTTHTLTLTVTSILDNCWTVAVMGSYDGNSPPAAGSGTTRRTYDAAFGTWGLFDSNAAITPAGSTSLVATYVSNAGGINGVMASFAPDVPAAGQPTMRRWGGVQGMTPGGLKPGRGFSPQPFVRSSRSHLYVPASYERQAA